MNFSIIKKKFKIESLTLNTFNLFLLSLILYKFYKKLFLSIFIIKVLSI